MIHTVLVIALALRAEAEFKLRVCELRPSADHTAMPCGLSVGSGDRNSTLPLTDAPHILRETGTVRVFRLVNGTQRLGALNIYTHSSQKA